MPKVGSTEGDLQQMLQDTAVADANLEVTGLSLSSSRPDVQAREALLVEK